MTFRQAIIYTNGGLILGPICRWVGAYVDGLVQERRNSIANAVELRLSCINPSIWGLGRQKQEYQTGISNCIPQNTVGCDY